MAFGQALYPYLQNPTPNSMIVSWKTSSNNETTVFYGTTASNLNVTFTGTTNIFSDTGYNNNYYYHTAKITNLQPNTKYYYKIKADKLSKPDKNAFSGKIFVLINGASFSASSILTSKLKNDKRAVLVGEETGGANDGTVAGFYSYQTLPNSRIDLPIGLVFVQPDITPTNTKKGVVPDIPVQETMDDIIHKKDPQLEWIINEIKKEKTAN